MKIGFYTLGCKVNQYETQAMEQLCRQAGHTVGQFGEACDCYIVNTCSVTAVADKKCRNVIRRLKRERPDAVIGVCGCYSQHDSAAVAALGVDIIGGSAQREQFLRDVLTATAHIGVDEALKRRTFEVLPAGGLEGRTRALLKVQDGCTNFCTYCIIPYTRGPVRSAPVELAVSQAVELSRQGFREIVINGIEIASWGVDLPGKPPLEHLLTEVSRAVPDLRIRLGSLEPRIITPGFCDALSSMPNLCPQFHLSMQSGCDTVLRRMHRKYGTERFYQSVCLLKERFPGCCITTDMIVGFPGETPEEHAQSLAFIRKCGFGDMHIFPYSRRPGTPADKMPDQIGSAVKEQRSREAIAIAEELSRAYRSAMVGTTVPVLFEQTEEGLFTGHAPNYVKIYADASELHNQIRDVEITELYKDGVFGHVRS